MMDLLVFDGLIISQKVSKNLDTIADLLQGFFEV